MIIKHGGHDCLRNWWGVQRFVGFYFLIVLSGFWLAEQANSHHVDCNGRAVADPGGVRGVKSNPPLAHSLVWKIPIWTFTFAQKYLSGNLRTPPRTPLHRILDPPQQSTEFTLILVTTDIFQSVVLLIVTQSVKHKDQFPDILEVTSCTFGTKMKAQTFLQDSETFLWNAVHTS